MYASAEFLTRHGIYTNNASLTAIAKTVMLDGVLENKSKTVLFLKDFSCELL